MSSSTVGRQQRSGSCEDARAKVVEICGPRGPPPAGDEHVQAEEHVRMKPGMKPARLVELGPPSVGNHGRR